MRRTGAGTIPQNTFATSKRDRTAGVNAPVKLLGLGFFIVAVLMAGAMSTTPSTVWPVSSHSLAEHKALMAPAHAACGILHTCFSRFRSSMHRLVCQRGRCRGGRSFPEDNFASLAIPRAQSAICPNPAITSLTCGQACDKTHQTCTRKRLQNCNLLWHGPLAVFSGAGGDACLQMRLIKLQASEAPSQGGGGGLLGFGHQLPPP